ncbi:BolA family protein [Marinospirillum alkaliphilum]|uniref:Transcriptional regulator, BolA protein family n=1 Tax=Marinospirillum alkaliphilum DSM 21637 TaxID=1122209 RepID=A0A1K1V5K3_9GAMM|nr:BolA/IbaG family iron-sulfur metabolism protein [Marinospirillum alkaliphilum]SFX20052.1 transcriptional regulator, BolA protein family [Marinospirillum alkaliphilum DSM 21637]
MAQTETGIRKKLNAALQPEWLQIENESDRHSGPPGRESHFKITLVSEGFAGLLPVKRHQKIYALLADELAGPVHALALHLYTPQEWLARGEQRPDSPNCKGGGK